jgi:hypothetical protein
VARNRNGRFTSTYRTRLGTIATTPTFSTAKESDDRAHACAAIERQGRDARAFFRGPRTAYPLAKRGHVTVVAYAPGWLAGHRLEPTSFETYSSMMKHVIRGLGSSRSGISPQRRYASSSGTWRTRECPGLRPGLS